MNPERDSPAAPLPTRRRRSAPGGRHRGTESFAVPSDAPALVLAVPGEPGTEADRAVGNVIALNRTAHPGLNIDAGRPADLPAVLAPFVSPGPDGAPPIGAVVVPLTASSRPGFADELRSALGRIAIADPTTVLALADSLGPHPLIAQAMHTRLTEARLAREDRVRLLTMVTAADGIVVAIPGDGSVAADAEVTCVLLASRLAIPVLPAMLGTDQGTAAAVVADAAERLRAAGAAQVALSPCLIGPETGLDLVALAAESKTEPAAAIGAHPVLVQLIAERYATALEAAWAAQEAAERR